MCVPTGTGDWERPERAPCSAGWAPRRQKSSRCSARSRSRGGLERRPIDPRLWARNLDVGNEAPATGFGRSARGGGAGVGVGCAGPRRTTGRANGAREQKNILAAAPAFGRSLDMTMGRVCAGWQGRGRAGSARGFALVCSPVRLIARSPTLATQIYSSHSSGIEPCVRMPKTHQNRQSTATKWPSVPTSTVWVARFIFC